MQLMIVLTAASLAVTAFTSAAARAEVFAFQIDSSQSSLTLSTTVAGGAIPTGPQGANSLVTSYSGTLFVDITGSTIQLLPQSSLVANINGNWLPGDDYDAPGYTTTAAPGNYGTTTDLTLVGGPSASNSAVRDLVIGLSDPLAKPLALGTFNEAGTATDFTSGTVFYDFGASPPITDLANTVNPGPTVDAPGSGLLVELGNQKTLTIPVAFLAQYNIAILPIVTQFNGTIVATVPEPASAALMATMCATIIAFAGRRQRSVRW